MLRSGGVVRALSRFDPALSQGDTKRKMLQYPYTKYCNEKINLMLQQQYCVSPSKYVFLYECECE